MMKSNFKSYGYLQKSNDQFQPVQILLKGSIFLCLTPITLVNQDSCQHLEFNFVKLKMKQLPEM